MEEISILLEDILNRDLIRMVISGSKKKEGLQKVKVRPVEKRGSLLFRSSLLQRHRRSMRILTQTGRGSGYFRIWRTFVSFRRRL